MADDRMKDDDRQRNMGTGGREDQGFGQGQQSPGRNPQGGQQGGGQQTGGQQGGQQKGNLNIDDEDEFGGGTSGQRGGQPGGQGGQGRGGQNR
jgi:hypothetical protein